LAYTVPVYPQHWSVGATELIISGTRSPSVTPSEISPPESSKSGSLSVTSTRTTKALDVPPGWIDDRKLRVIREQWNRKVLRVADTQTDGKWVVLAPAGTSTVTSSDSPMPDLEDEIKYLNSSPALQLYRLYLPPPSASVAGPTPRISFVRSLYGQVGPISSLALSDGRCISLGLNGSLWVWDLEAGTGAEISPASIDAVAPGESAERGTVVFDDRRIVSTHANGTLVHRFDV